MRNPIWVQSVLYVCLYLSPYLRISVSLSGHPHLFFGNHEIAARNFSQRMQPQSMGSNPLSGSMVCPSFHMSVRSSVGLLRFFVFVLTSSVGIQCRNAFIPTLGSSQYYIYVCLSVHTFLCLSIYLSLFISVRSSASLFGDYLRGP